MPSLVNFCGIFFLRFGPVTALLVDYRSITAGVLNAMRPRLGSSAGDAYKHQ